MRPYISLQNSYHSLSVSFADIATEVSPLSCADNNLTEEYEESGKDICKPNPADIPEGKMFKLYQTYAYIYSTIFCYYSLNFCQCYYFVAIIEYIV